MNTEKDILICTVGTENFIKKVFKEKKYIKRIYDFYTSPDLAEKNSFKIDPLRKCIVHTYSDGKRTARFSIELFQPTEEKLKIALIDLSETYLKE